MKALSEKQITEQLKKIPENWFVSGSGQLSSEFRFHEVKTAKNFIICVIDAAENHNHHPELYWMYKKVKISIQTHEVGGLSKLDFKFAAQVEECVKKS